jgi:midasin
MKLWCSSSYFILYIGIVTQAVVHGYWLVLEDIDRATIDLVAALTTLIESRVLYLPDRSEAVRAHSSFRLIATRSGTSASINNPYSISSMQYFYHFWLAVVCTTPTEEEVSVILSCKYPSLTASVRGMLMETYLNFNAVVKNEGGGLRAFTLRDLIKSAGRIASRVALNSAVDFTTELQRLQCVGELLDVFALSSRNQAILERAIHSLSVLWNLTEELVYNRLLTHRPDLNVTETSLVIGRVSLSLPLPSTTRQGVSDFGNTSYSLRIMESLAAAVVANEPVLLVGETGGGKTTVVQVLSNLCSQRLLVQNLSLTTDSSDLIGGFRPVTLVELFQPTYSLFITLFQATFSSQNTEFLHSITIAYRKQHWRKLLKAFQKAYAYALKKMELDKALSTLSSEWTMFHERVDRFEANLTRIESGFAFGYVDGIIIRAMREGMWVLLDEINLASPETLQVLSGILDGRPFCLTEKGDVEVVVPHASFKIFAAMNPPTDVGKKELPSALRSRFTEIYVSEMTDPLDIRVIVEELLRDVSGAPLTDIVDLYLACRAASEGNLEDGAGQRPRYSLRSLTRALKATRRLMDIGVKPLVRALYEGFMLSFQTQLNDASKSFMKMYLQKFLQVDSKNLLHPPPRPGGKSGSAEDWVLVKPFWLHSGPFPRNNWADRNPSGIQRFVLTPSVESCLRDIAAGVAANIAPILLQVRWQ